MSQKFSLIHPDSIAIPESFQEMRNRKRKEEAAKNNYILNRLESCIFIKEHFKTYPWGATCNSSTVCSKLIQYDSEKLLQFHTCYLCKKRMYEYKDCALVLKMDYGGEDCSKTVCYECYNR
jgi:hypothetical protein